MSRLCAAITKKGKPCPINADRDSIYCHVHNPIGKHPSQQKGRSELTMSQSDLIVATWNAGSIEGQISWLEEDNAPDLVRALGVVARCLPGVAIVVHKESDTFRLAADVGAFEECHAKDFADVLNWVDGFGG